MRFRQLWPENELWQFRPWKEALASVGQKIIIGTVKPEHTGTFQPEQSDEKKLVRAQRKIG